MVSPFFAQPPGAVKPKYLSSHFGLLTKRFGYLVWQIVVPFRFQPESIAAFPESDKSNKTAEATVKQCQWIFDQAEQRRNQLEQKAQSTFGLMIFLVPLLSSAFVFVAGKAALGHLRTIAIVLVSAAALFVLLGFISAIRAVGVKTSETLSLDSVLQKNGVFRPYEESFHAKGLLYCASMNTAMNDHLAQFVRGAHSMTAIAVLLLLLAAIPTSIAAVNSSSEPTTTKVLGPVEVFSKGAFLQADPGTCKESTKTDERINMLEKKIEALAPHRAHRAASKTHQ